MKLKKLNEKQIALTNSSMQKIQGGQQTRFTYSHGSEEDFNAGMPSTDRNTQVWLPPAGGLNGFWVTTGTYTNADAPTNPDDPR